jgi:hypothetical protein
MLAVARYNDAAQNITTMPEITIKKGVNWRCHYACTIIPD